MAKKVYKSLDEALLAKERAERFTSEVLGDSDRADEIASLSLEEWLDETGRRIANNNPTITGGHIKMANRTVQTKAELLDEVEGLRSENSTLQELVDELSERLDAINALTLDGEGDEEDEEEGEDEEDEEEEDE